MKRMRSSWLSVLAICVFLSGGKVYGNGFSIVTESLPEGTELEPYSVTLEATNGTSPYAWSISADAGGVSSWGGNGCGQTNVPPGLSNATAVAGGGNHSLALQPDGTVVAWGDNRYGQATVPAGLGNVVAVAAGADHSLALKSDGTVAAWGRNNYGQLAVPAGLSNVVALAGGHTHSLALKSDGTVVGWGNNNVGQINVPAGLSNVTMIASFNSHSLALQSNGTVMAWGDNTFGQTSVPSGLTNVVGVAAGANNSLALRSNRTVAVWGDNTYGQTNVPPGLIEVVAIAAGQDHVLALRSDGVVVGWGSDADGRATPPAGLEDVTAISAGWYHSLAIRPSTAQLPDGLALSSGGVISGTPTQAGTNLVTFVVQDGIGASTNKALEIVIAAGPVTGELAVAILAEAGTVVQGAELSFTADIEGNVASNRWDFGDGTSVMDAVNVSHAWAETGEYAVVLTAYNDSCPTGVSATSTVSVVEPAPPCTRHVWQDSPSSAYPFDAWSNAAHTIQAAVDAAVPGDTVLVTNGVYETGSRATPGHLTQNRVVITNAIVVRSVNGPAATVIRGQGPRGTNAVRGVFMQAGALIGFMVTNGHTRTDGDGSYDQAGGGINMYATTLPVVSNCVISGNAAYSGGGSTWGTLYNCIVSGNSVVREAGGSGGSGMLYNCLIAGNSGVYGGGSDQCTLNNCTITGNSAAYGGGIYNCRLNNCIVYSNSPANVSVATCRYTCTSPLQSGEGNLASDPKLISGGHIAANSPCAGMGSSSYAIGTDIDGEAWLTPPSMGCDEPASGPITGQLAVAIVTTSLPVGTAMESYNAVLEATNGTLPYAWSTMEGEGGVASWGYNASGQTNVPAELGDVLSVSGGGNHVLALKPDGTVVAWGDNRYGQATVPAGLGNVVAVAAGADHSLALKSDGTVAAWGRNNYGQLTVPAGLSNVVALAGGHTHSLALKSDGTVVAWGNNNVGQINVPAGLSNVLAIAGFGSQSLALKSDGRVVAWGDNAYGQTDVPAGLSNATAIVAGAAHCLALRSDGTVVGWGNNNVGQINVPAGLSNVVALAAGQDHSLALRSDGVVVGWGSDADGRATPPAGLEDVTAISASWYSSLAIRPSTAQLPDGLALSSGGVISGTPTQAGTNLVTFVVQDGIGASTNKALEIVIAAGPVTGELAVAILAEAGTVVQGAELSFTADIEGNVASNRWDFGDGTSVMDAVNVSHAWAETGEYAVVLTAYNDSCPTGVSATSTVSVVEPAPPCTRHVWQDSPSSAYPFDAWSNAAHTIQAAVDAAVPGDTVLVTNGVYETGSRATPGHLTQNRVVITNAIVVRSVNGPAATVIRGQGPRGTNAVRGVFMQAGALIGFMVTNGHTRTDGDGSYDQAGGGINMYATTLPVVSNCVISGNAAYSGGGSTWGTLYNCIVSGNSVVREAGGSGGSGMLYNCLIAGNSGVYGGGSDQCTLNNCTITGNSAAYGGGIYNCRLNNCIVYSNSPANVSVATCRYTCTSPLQSGEGNLASDPKLISGGHIAANSPCAGMGSSSYAIGTDIDGEAWLTPPSMGCDEPASGPITGQLAVAIVSSALSVAPGVEVAFAADIEGRTTSNRWDFGDGTSEMNTMSVPHAWTETGEYAVVLTAYNDTCPLGVSATATVSIITSLNQYSVLAVARPGGTISPSGEILVPEGAGTNFMVQASNGFHIARVLVDNRDVGEFDFQCSSFSYVFSTVEADHNIEAYFNSAPVLGVAVSPTQGVAPLRVRFDFVSSVDMENNIVRSEVDCNEDGLAEWSADGKAVLSGEFASPGVYTNILKVIDGFGLSASTSIVVTVLGQAPVAVLNASTNSAPAPMVLTLSAEGSTVAVDHTLVSYEWDFNGDGVYDELTSQPFVIHTYGEVGLHHAVVRVMDDQGLQDTAAITVVVLAPLGTPPIVLLTNQPTSGTIPLEVVFTAVASDSDGTVVSYAWDFDGDGTPDLMGPNSVVTQSYQSVGTFTPSVQVADDSGLSGSASALVTTREASKLRAWISVPKNGDRIWGSNVTVHAQTAPGNLTASIQIQCKATLSGEWTDIGHLLVPPANSFTIAWNVSALVNGQFYDLRAVAVDTETNAVISETITVIADASTDKTPGKVLETIQNGKVVKEQTFSKEETANCILADGTGVYVPAGSIASNATVIIEKVDVNTNSGNGAAHGLVSAEVNRKVSFDGGLQSRQPVVIEIPYADADHDGIVDGTVIPAATLDAFWYDVVSNEWRRVLETTVDQTACRVRLKTYHLTEFGLFGDVSLLSPDRGGVLLYGTVGATNYAAPKYLTDGNRASYWRSCANPSDARFTYGFTNFSGAILDEAIFYNSGAGETNAYSKEFEIRTSMDGSNFTVVVTGTLAAAESPETYDMGGSTCRFVQVVIKSGYSVDSWALAEFSLKGSLTADPDGDGLDDSWEMQYFGCFDWSGTDDYETDGLDNQSEFDLGSDPTVDDTDSDGMPDAWEAQYGFLLTTNDALADADGDRMPNMHEYIAGTDPANSTSLLEVIAPIYSGTWQSNVVLGWQTVIGRTYRLYGTTNLTSTSWLTNSGPINGTGGFMLFTNSLLLQQYFGVGVELSP